MRKGIRQENEPVIIYKGGEQIMSIAEDKKNYQDQQVAEAIVSIAESQKQTVELTKRAVESTEKLLELQENMFGGKPEVKPKSMEIFQEAVEASGKRKEVDAILEEIIGDLETKKHEEIFVAKKAKYEELIQVVSYLRYSW